MTDENTSDDNENVEKATSDKPTTFNVLHQYLRDLSFENFLTPQEIIDCHIEPHGDISLNVANENVSGSIYNVDIKLKITGLDETLKKDVYMIEILYSALADISGFKDADLDAILMVELPKLMFPYVRAIISDSTREGGFPPLVMAPIDFLGLWIDNQMAKTEKIMDETDALL